MHTLPTIRTMRRITLSTTVLSALASLSLASCGPHAVDLRGYHLAYADQPAATPLPTVRDARLPPIAPSYRLERTENGRRYTVHAGLTFDACMHRLDIAPREPLGCVADR